MKLLNREDIKFRLMTDLKSKSYDRKFKNELIKLTNKRISMIKTISIMSDDSYVPLSDLELYWYLKLLKDINFDFNYDLNEDERFTAQEITDFELFYIDNNSVKNDTFELHDVSEVVANQEYVCCKISYQELVKLYEQGLITYSFLMQRESTIRKIGINSIQTPTVYRTSIDQMKREMKTNKYMSSMITFNILSNGGQRYSYDKENRTLLFTKDEQSICVIPDGFNRLSAIVEVLTENPNVQGHMQIKIWVSDVQRMQYFIKQEASGNKLSAQKINELSDDIFSTITRNINVKGNSDNNELFNKIGSINEVKSGIRYVTSELFSDSLRDNFEDIISNASDIDELQEFLVRYYNYIVSKYEKQFKFNVDNKLKSNDNYIKSMKKLHPCINNKAFLIYNSIARKVFKVENWRSEVDSILFMLDFENNNEYWDEMNITNDNRLDSRTRKEFYDVVGGGQ